jgi:hypothetical protein
MLSKARAAGAAGSGGGAQAQLERDAPGDAGPVEHGVDLLPQPRLGAHLDERVVRREGAQVGRGRARARARDGDDQRLVGEGPVHEVGRAAARRTGRRTRDPARRRAPARPRRFPVRGLLVAGLVSSTVAAAVLLGSVLAGWGLVAVLVPLFLVVATRGPVSSNATVLGVQRAQAAGSASAVLGALMFAGGILATRLLALGGEGTARRWCRWCAGRAAGHRVADPDRRGPLTRSARVR